MRNAMVGLGAVIVLSMVSLTRAAEPVHGAATAPHGAATAAAHHAAQPVLPAVSLMPGLVLIGIGALFLWAATIGPIVRYHAPEEAPEVSHDEHGHGAHDAYAHDAHGAHGH
jgi:ABC-type nickel/cobalt efflux system permease component RcnA